MTDIDNTLAERRKTHGKFTDHARCTVTLKETMRQSKNWEALDFDQKEALDMIAHKIGRILEGDPNFHDSWHDIVGYTKLGADRLAEKCNTGYVNGLQMES